MTLANRITIYMEKSACLDFGTAFSVGWAEIWMAKLSATKFRLSCVETRRPPGVMLNFGDVS